MTDDDLEILFERAEAIEAVVAGLAERISQDYRGKALVPSWACSRPPCPSWPTSPGPLTIPAEIDFLEASSYGNGTASSGQVRIVKDIDRDIHRQHLLVVDCIADSGRTLKTLMERLRERHPRVSRPPSCSTSGLPGGRCPCQLRRHRGHRTGSS